MRKMTARSNILELTPYQVAMWFQQSNDEMLRQIGRDLEPATYSHPEGFHITTDLVACLLHLGDICLSDGRFQRGANATIAQCIFGDRTKTGGAYNSKIQEIKRQLTAMFWAINDTTTTPEPEPEPVAMLEVA